MGDRKIELVDPIWEQQEGETATNYGHFLAYAGLKPYERTFTRAWRILTDGSSKEGKPISTYYRRIAGTWGWRERAAAKDIFDTQNMQTLWIERDKERREKAYAIGGKLSNQAERILNKIQEVPDSQLKLSLSEAKDVALAGAQLQETAIPSTQLAIDQMQWILASLPPEKRLAVIDRLRKARDGSNSENLLMSDSVVDAEYDDVTDYDDES